MNRRQDRLAVWEAIQFVWHYRYRHPGHAAGVWYDESANIVRCPCGKTWGAS